MFRRGDGQGAPVTADRPGTRVAACWMGVPEGAIRIARPHAIPAKEQPNAHDHDGFPILPGKIDQAKSIPAMFQKRPDEYRRSRERSGVTLERVFLQRTPDGDLAVVRLEATKPIAEVLASPLKSDLPIDRDFARMVKEIHGVDLAAPPPSAPPEVLGHWQDPNVTKRLPGLAFAVPTLPGRTAAGRAFVREAFEARRDELTASRRALKGSRESVTLQPTPMGDLICVYVEGEDPVAANRGFASSRSPYDVWFKGQLTTLFPPQIDFDKPVPPNEQIFSVPPLG